MANKIVDHSYWVCSWSITCRRCSNYIFILDLTPGFNGLGKDNCKTKWETFGFCDLVCLILVRATNQKQHILFSYWFIGFTNVLIYVYNVCELVYFVVGMTKTYLNLNTNFVNLNFIQEPMSSGSISLTIFPFHFKFKILFCSYPYFDEVIMTKFCTWHDSCHWAVFSWHVQTFVAIWLPVVKFK